MRIQNGMVFHSEKGFQKADLEIRDGILSGIMTGTFGSQTDEARTRQKQTEDSKRQTADGETQEDVLDASGCYVLPGLVDVHFHGCAGHDFCEGTAEAVSVIEQYELSHGITTICPATMTLPEERLIKICKTASAFGGDCLKGINLEGPFLSAAKKGAQNGAYLQDPDSAMLRRLNEASGGMVKLVSIAPELPGAMECIRECGREFQFSVAHTQADYQTAAEAMKLGAKHVTHLFNAMPAFTHRAPGVVGAAFDYHADVELICDGIHIDPCVVRAVFQLFGDDQVVLISDSMMAAGMEDGEYELGGQPVKVRGNLATLADGTLAGSATNLYDCMVTAIRLGIDPVSAVKAASCNPARTIGLAAECGDIREGMPADLLIADQNWKLQKVIKRGRIV